jgi:hypothetical protein
LPTQEIIIHKRVRTIFLINAEQFGRKHILLGVDGPQVEMILDRDRSPDHWSDTLWIIDRRIPVWDEGRTKIGCRNI